MAPGLAPVGNERREGAADETISYMLDGGTDNVVAAANGEGLMSWEISQAFILYREEEEAERTMPWPL